MPRVVYQMKVEKIIDHTPIVRELRIRPIEPDRFKFRAGQFVTLHVPHEPKPALRAYSLASTEEREDGFVLLVKYVDNGIASKYFWELEEGAMLQFTGPFGRVFFAEPPSQQVVFLNTGTGVSQHYSYLVSKMKTYPNVKYRMLFGVRTEDDIYYKPELDALTEQLPDFKYEFVLSRPKETWTGKKGYVQHFMDEFDYENIDTTFYLCGNGGMIKEVKKTLIEEKGFDKKKIHSEAFD